MFQLRPYQNQLVAEARNHLATGIKGVLIQSPPGSGKSVVIAEIVRLATKKGGKVLFLAHRRELLDNIVETLNDNDVDLSKVIVLSAVMAKNRLSTLPPLSLIVTDEGHHGKAKTYMDIYGHFKDVPRLGFTATPYRLNGEGFKDIYDEMVEGPTIQWLIDHHNLAPYRWFSIPLIDRAKVDFKNMTREAESSAKLFESDATIQGDIIGNYKKYANGKQAIVYAPTIEVSKLIVRWFNQEGIYAVHADGKTPTKERDQITADFKAKKITILSNVDLISEGFNVPDVGVIILCRPTQSIVLHLQQSMRGMRYRPDKTSIILDHVGNGANLGLPADEFEWSIEGRKKKSSSSSGPPKMICPTCGQQFLLKSLLKIGDKPHCPFCLQEIEMKEKESSVTFDETVEMIELDAEKAKIARLSKKKFSTKQSLEFNYAIAKAKVKMAGKGNPLFKMFGSLTAYRKKEYALDTLEEFSMLCNVSMEKVLKAYDWAYKKSLEKPEMPEWAKNTFY
ncbi:DEAD/DEAH box helicase [Enterococcus dongliensis]|uniref:DEAD/DEAH box helicase n=1 Tax=Enterococcus dongliensis TaxID=2559925 RepID=UPI002890AC02|nr:DEAD/DEAH box helicase [Enterococcus dongliensis]MDT2675083.1 DEAD/DEAH box helicase [Enterococcus dongliensis]